MTIQRFTLRGDFIELNALLKLLALVPSGGAAKALIGGGGVTVDGAVEMRIRRKLRAGSSVSVGDVHVHIEAEGSSP